MGSELTLTDHRWPQQKSMIGALYYLDMYSSSIIEGSCVCAGDDVCVCVHGITLQCLASVCLLRVSSLTGTPPSLLDEMDRRVRVDQSMRTTSYLVAGVRVDQGLHTPLSKGLSLVPLAPT